VTAPTAIGQVPKDPVLPEGFAVVLDRAVRRMGDGVLCGGWPTRMVRLSPSAQRMLSGDRLVVAGRRSALLARRLLDAGMAQPRPQGTSYSKDDVTIVVPVRNRADMLERLLSSLAGGPEVVVVDDGSAAWPQLQTVASQHGVRFLHHPSRRGPGAARNTGLGEVETPLVAFVDSDCVARPHWLEPLVAHFDDPTVGLVAPRVVALREAVSRRDWLTAYEKVRSSLDRGLDEALVVPRGRISWVPSAAFVARRLALGEGFAEQLPLGEDVDLVWRLQKAGWRVRYEPSSQVAHDHRRTWLAWGQRKARYGTSAAVLGQRHGRQVAPVVLTPWQAAAWLLLLAQRRRTNLGAALIVAAAGGLLARRLPVRSGRYRVAASFVAKGFIGSGFQVASALVRAWWPLTVLFSARSGRMRRAVLGAALFDGLADWERHGRPMSLSSYLVVRRADDLAFGAGLWVGAARSGTLQPLLPEVVFKSAGQPHGSCHPTSA
jgi:mycofactocin system glycosyltransferase